MRLPVFVVALVSALTASAASQVPYVIQHTGRLLDGSNAPVTGDVLMEFAIYPEGGPAPGEAPAPAIWTQKQTVHVDQGVFNVTLGDAAAGGPIPESVFRGSNNRWLGLTVDGVPLNPRIKFGSAPYALRAAQAEGLDCVGCIGDTQIGTISGTKITPGTLPSDAISGDGFIRNAPAAPQSASLDITGSARLGGNLTASDVTVKGLLSASGDATISGKLTAGDTTISGKLSAGDLAIGRLTAGEVPWARLSGTPAVTAGSGLTGGGALAGDVSIGLAPGGVTRAMLAQDGCSSGQVLKWNGSAWSCAGDDNLPQVNTTGRGLTGNGTAGAPLALGFSGTGSDDRPARADHNHDTNYAAKSSGGEFFTNWGREDCPTGTSLIYAGYAYNSRYTYTGGGAESMCLKPGDPGPTLGSIGNGDWVRPTGTDHASYSPTNLVYKKIKCAICYVDVGPCVQMWGTDSCPAGFTNKVVSGLSMGGYYAHQRTNRQCVGQANFDGSVTESTNWGDIWYMTIVENSTDIPDGTNKYPANRLVKCAKCCRQ